MLKKLSLWLASLFKKKVVEYPQIPKAMQGKHDCALRSLYVALPDIPVKDMRDKFMNCCEWWPYGGVSNKEFNIVLDALKIKDKFEYVAPESIKINHLLKRKKNTFIALIYGHYTVVSRGIILDKYTGYSDKKKVYCYWRLK